MLRINEPEVFREKIRQNMSQLVGNITDQEKITVNLEKAIFNYALKEATSKKILKKWENPFFVQLYIDRLKTITVNLKRPELLDQLRNGEITPQTLVFMTHQEMNPTHWKSMIERKIKRDANRFNVNMKASTDTFTCRKCKSKKCTYYELQTRSADEPATIFITCLNCSHNFKS
jgi:DNA-directed RNA polymerase subunit M/transcription elongation factor TFIIS